jgi:hypothetical protein
MLLVDSPLKEGGRERGAIALLIKPTTTLLVVGASSNQLLWADTAVLIVLHSLGHAISWDNMAEEMGCSSALFLAWVIYYTVNLLHNAHTAKLNDIGTWREDFPTFATHISSVGLVFTNTVDFVERHFQPVSWPPCGDQTAPHSMLLQDLY